MTDNGKQMNERNAPNEASWVAEMRAYHQQTGVYRSEDVARLLGEPWTRVEINLSVDGAASACIVS